MEKVAGLKRKVDELNSEVVSARDVADCVRGAFFELESKVEVITSLELENDGLKTKVNTITSPLTEEIKALKNRLLTANVQLHMMRQSATSSIDYGNCDTVASKEAYIAKHVKATLTKILPRTKPKKKAKFLTKMISDGKMFGVDGQHGYKEIFLGHPRKKFEPWRILQALDQDSRCGNFSTVEIMRDVEGLENMSEGFSMVLLCQGWKMN